MGRRVKSPAPAPARNHALLGWGAFLSVLLGIFAPRMGMSITASIALAATCLVVFGVIWFLSVSGTASRSNS